MCSRAVRRVERADDDFCLCSLDEPQARSAITLVKQGEYRTTWAICWRSTSPDACAPIEGTVRRLVTCLVWAAVLVVVALLILVVGWAMFISALPLWPPFAVAVITFRGLTRSRLPAGLILIIAGVSALALAVDLPFGLPDYSLAMRDIGYTGSFGGALGINVVDLPRLLLLSLPFCLLSGIAVGSTLAAVRRLRFRAHIERSPSRTGEILSAELDGYPEARSEQLLASASQPDQTPTSGDDSRHAECTDGIRRFIAVP